MYICPSVLYSVIKCHTAIYRFFFLNIAQLTCFGGGSLELGPEGEEGHVAQETIVVRVKLGMVSLVQQQQRRENRTMK